MKLSKKSSSELRGVCTNKELVGAFPKQAVVRRQGLAYFVDSWNCIGCPFHGTLSAQMYSMKEPQKNETDDMYLLQMNL